jgi:hypothetical protein
MRIGISLHLDERFTEAGVQADHVARLDGDAILFANPHQILIADELALAAEMSMEIDQHRASLDACHGHGLDTERIGLDAFEAGPVFSVTVLSGADDMLAAAPAVVEHGFRHAVAVGVEERTDMGEGVPLGRVLGVEQDGLVAYDVGVIGVLGPQRN